MFTPCGIMHRRGCLLVTRLSQPYHQQATSSVHYTTSCKHSLVLLRIHQQATSSVHYATSCKHSLVLLRIHQQATSSVHYTTGCKHSAVLLIARNELIELTNKLLSLHVVVCLYPYSIVLMGTAVAQWLRYCATNRRVAGSIPAGVIGIFH